jgi:hypothetical protein
MTSFDATLTEDVGATVLADITPASLEDTVTLLVALAV